MDTEKDSRGVLPVSEVHSLRLAPSPQLLGLLHADGTHPNKHTRKVSTSPGTYTIYTTPTPPTSILMLLTPRPSLSLGGGGGPAIR